jgi:hypothetical protein
MLAGLGATSGAQAGEAEAKSLLKAMSDYLAAQKNISLGYDANFEVANSGTIDLSRPDKIRATRAAGFANLEMVFDGKTLSMLGKDANLYVQIDAPGTIEHLIDELRDKFHKPLPGADLLLPNVYDVLMADVIDVKDLGSGVIGGTECDHLAFRTKDLDWQIWIAQGERPYPCRYVITSKQVDQAPQYSVQIRDWKTGDAIAPETFVFDNETKAEKIALDELPGEMPDHFAIGDTQ